MRVDSDRYRKTLIVALVLGALVLGSLFLIGSLPNAFAGDSPTVWTDKADYWPEETVTITGTGFNPGQSYDIIVIRPDYSVVTGDGTFTPGYDNVTADANGHIQYFYILDGVLGLYKVQVYPSPWNWSIGQIPIATTTFTDDAAVNLDQVRNGAATPLPTLVIGSMETLEVRTPIT